MKPPRQVALETVRLALRAAVDRDGLRPVARAVGMTPTGLLKALDDSTSPRGSTQVTMREWYVRNARSMGPSESTVREALGLLLEGLPDDAVVEGMHAVAEVLRQTYRSAKLEPPAWIPKVLK